MQEKPFTVKKRRAGGRGARLSSWIPVFTGMSAPGSRRDLRGESPLLGECPLPVAEGNCVAVRRGGEQPEANMQSVG